MRYMALIGMLLATTAMGQDVEPPEGDPERGRQIFENETFGGNGTVCSDCHDNRFNMLQNPQAFLDRADLFDGFEDLGQLRAGRAEENQNEGGFLGQRNFRAVMLMTGVDPSQTIASGQVPHAQNLGWTGNGSPNADVGGVLASNGETDDLVGDLRDFVDGAILQHMPLESPVVDNRFERILGANVPRLATPEEKNDLEAFLLQLARPPEELFTGPDGDQNFYWFNFYANVGAREFVENRCNRCHGSTGSVSKSGHRTIVNTGTFLRSPTDTESEHQAFTIQALNNVIARETDGGGLFHNNSARDLRDAIRHYDTDLFNNSPAAGAVGNISLSRWEQFTIRQFLIAENLRLNLDQFLNPRIGENPSAELEDAMQMTPRFWWQFYYLRAAVWADGRGWDRYARFLAERVFRSIRTEIENVRFRRFRRGRRR